MPPTPLIACAPKWMLVGIAVDETLDIEPLVGEYPAM